MTESERGWPIRERSLLPTVLGVSPFVAIGVESGLTVLGVLVDLLRQGTLGLVFTVFYVAGCVLATAWVRRDGLFGPMVAPPLLLAFAVPAVVLVAGTPKPGAGMGERLLVIGAPLVNAFPVMASTTGAVLALGAFRLLTQRIGKAAPEPVRPAPVKPERAAARGAARTSASPGRS